MLQKKIIQLFEQYPSVIFGFTDIAYSVYADRYQSALVFATPYGEQLSINTYTEEKFDRGIWQARKVSEEILSHLE